jgi:threonine dehydrogenase-like Zn-dependent dehydrogenase
VAAARPGATVLLFSVPAPASTYELNLEDIYQKELTITGSKINPDTHARAAALINQGILRLDPIITHQYPVSQIQEAIQMQMSNESLKVIVVPE